ncbi:TadE/TadG family type IV pilus assembly protein [Rubellimicrobium sp. CFH 75288]|uniref:TadE/TadG family type IV pilus assembly protein n=1 Tax=Rubellimicrobium sp. CFH 75288 TaxID=2697034 RepID=UPI0014122337|nr:pilus assembly protein [Rubellimicrobium sp. CFH 75288]NAZ36564.1 pilus assembly protein [Rubellimicrobium sp. CFH 75288]
MIRRFLRDERGSIAVEGMLILPALVWVFLGTFVFFDGFRAQAINARTAYTIGDILSRETQFVTPAYLDGLFALQGTMTATDQPRRMRISVVRYQSSGDRYRVVWSQVRGSGVAALRDADMPKVRPFLPIMPDAEIAIVTETWVPYRPVARVGIEPFTFRDFVVTRPRFAANLCWNTQNTGGTMATATC